MLDQQFENLFAHASKSPYFDLERALCLTMESHMQQRLSIPLQENGRLFSLVKVFAWPSEELCACIRKSDADHLYLFEDAQKNLLKVETTEPHLRAIEKNDFMVILNEWLAKLINQNDLEQIILSNTNESKETLEQEIYLRAQVNARGNRHVFPENFVVHVHVV